VASDDQGRLNWMVWMRLALSLSALGSMGACSPSTSGNDGGGGPPSSLCVIGPCSGMLSGAFSQTFSCTQTFGHYGVSADTDFSLAATSPPSGVSSLDMGLDFSGAPPSALPAAVTLLGSAAPGGLRAASIALFLSDNSYFTATIGPPDTGAITLTIGGVQYRDGGTPGDVCLHGHVEATLAHQVGPTGGPGDSVFLSATF
jgi:hypothetical protein